MIKDKRFLTGLGSGLIIGSILLQLMNVAASGTGNMVLTGDENTGDPQEYTLKEVMDIADQHGYKLYEKDIKVYTQQEVDELVKAAEGATPVEPAAPQSEQPAEPAKQVEDPPAAPPEPTSFSVIIAPGMSSDQVAKALLEAKLITDVEAFKKELTGRKLENKIQVGTFTFEKKPSLAEIIAKITKA